MNKTLDSHTSVEHDKFMPEANEPYAPIPVSEAAALSEKYGKSIVIVIGWDQKHGLMHTTTYGNGPQSKAWAAQGGEVACKALGGVLDQSTHFEDYRLAQAKKLLAALNDLLGSSEPFYENRGANTTKELSKLSVATRNARVAIAEAEKFLV